MKSCLFCGRHGAEGSVEHVIPKWARKVLKAPGGLTLVASDQTFSKHEQRVAGRPALSITLNDTICTNCNNRFLSRIESRVASFLSNMASEARPTRLDPANQVHLATWAIKTSYLLELAFRQHYPIARPTPGYEISEPEAAWLWRKELPPPRSFVWLGTWDCLKSIPLNYEPSSTRMMEDPLLTGNFTSFTLGYVAFQVFTVNFVLAEKLGAPFWNPQPPPQLRDRLQRLWPETHSSVPWPPIGFAHDNWKELVTWGGALRPGQQ